MTKDDILPLYEYDHWANDRVFEAVSALSADQFTRDLGGSFRSVRNTLLHIIAGEWGWLTFWKERLIALPSWPICESDGMPCSTQMLSPTLWVEIERQENEFPIFLTDEALARMLPFRETQVSLMRLMQHLVKHSSYHRGQLALMMRQLGADPLATDFHVFLVEGFREGLR